MSNEQDKQTIWQQICNDATIHKEIEESHVFVFGDKNTGKRSLFKSLNKELFLNYENEEKSLPQVEEGISKNSLIDFKYLNVKKIGDTENGKLYTNDYIDVLTKMNIWMINSFIETDFLELIIKPEYLLKASFIVTLDLTKVSF